MAWWYNTESGALTSAGSIQSFFQSFQGDLGLSAGWHQLNISATATEAQAAAEAKKDFPSGTAPTTSVSQQSTNAVSQEVTGSATTFSSVQNALTGFYDVVTNGKMWRSLGWLLLGVVLMIAGLGLLLKNTVGKQIAGTLFPEVT